jgi:centrosomal protein CEP76
MIDYAPLKRIGDGKSLEIWSGMHTILSAKKGDVQDHCILLCNLFLGFRMNAFVTLGTDKENNPHIWVTTIDSHNQVYFWESLTGTCYAQQDQHHFRTVGCCFNDQDFFANVQVTDSCNGTKFNVTEPTLWKKLVPYSVERVPFSLRYVPFEPIQKEIELEMELTQSIEFYRMDHHLSCVWDEELSRLLVQPLWSLENAKVSGTNHSFSDDFQLGIKRYIPDGHTFKGFPFCTNYIHSQKLFSQLLKSQKCKDILLTRGDAVRMALQVKIHSYSDGVISCWVMVASRSL